MNWKLFFSTFLLIFVAELGDKTQLAAMARAATGAGGKWTVFFAASFALVCSTLVAVLIGGALTKLVPVQYIKIGAGVLFVGFGVAIFWNALAPAKAPEVAEFRPGAVTNMVLRLAARFELAAAEDYDRLAAEAEDARTRKVMAWLAGAEREHLDEIQKLSKGQAIASVQETFLEKLPSSDDVIHDVAVGASPVIEHAIEHEEATARFYAELGNLTPLTALKSAFALLAEQELDHVRRLRELLKD